MSASSSAARAEALIAAAEARVAAARAEGPYNPAYGEDHHEIRQKFRRLVDPGILKHNDKKSAGECFDTLLKLSDNLARDPSNPKFQSFKTTNKLIQRTLLDVNGGLEYAVELGFRLEVQDLQPIYVFHPTPQRLISLRVGAEVIREVSAARTEQEARAAEAARLTKAAKDAAVKKAMQAYEEDRMAVRRRAERESVLRDAAAARAAAGAAAAASASSPTRQPAPFPVSPPTLTQHMQPMNPQSQVLSATVTMPGELTTQDVIDEHNEYGMDVDAAEGDDAESEADGEEVHVPANPEPQTRSRRNRRRFPGGGASIAGTGEGDAAESDTTAIAGEEGEEDEQPPPYGMHTMPGGARGRQYPGDGRRLGD